MPTDMEDKITPDKGEQGTEGGQPTGVEQTGQQGEENQDSKKPVMERSLEEQVAYWKSMARKHEDREKDANKQLGELPEIRQQLADVQAKLHASEVEAARKDVRLAHPELSDSVFALCGETEPDKIREWGEKAAVAFAASASKEGQPDMGGTNQNNINPEERGARKAAQANNGSAAAGQPDEKAAIYKRIYEKYSANKSK
ncbi:hypothetical protein [Bifidobacterium apri]|uniref:hypothetical protein n=1 Tax=Bifidobacterium apri TaxID=1769423 RepID=UPI0035ED9BB9